MEKKTLLLLGENSTQKLLFLIELFFDGGFLLKGIASMNNDYGGTKKNLLKGFLMDYFCQKFDCIFCFYSELCSEMRQNVVQRTPFYRKFVLEGPFMANLYSKSMA